MRNCRRCARWRWKHLINPNTVVRAYLELEREGLVSKRRGTGTYVSPSARSLGEDFRLHTVRGMLGKAVTAARELGVPPEQGSLTAGRTIQTHPHGAISMNGPAIAVEGLTKRFRRRLGRSTT